jgi:uncharacterized ferritin-like protein (DUF455 family)
MDALMKTCGYAVAVSTDAQGLDMNEMRNMARSCLAEISVDEKLQAVRSWVRQWQRGELLLDIASPAADFNGHGRPERPKLVKASKVPRRGFGTVEGRAVMMHAIAHIEFNAINLALDAVQRFSDMPEDFYTDWMQVAAEEVYHFDLVRSHLRHLGSDYGDFPAHQGLWEMAEKTSADVLARMAMVPRVLEARGLDVTPGIQQKLRQARDENAVCILDIILHDEIGHVKIGNHWFHYLCKQRQLDPLKTFQGLLAEFYPKGLFGPFNLDARQQAGFTDDEMTLMTGAC